MQAKLGFLLSTKFFLIIFAFFLPFVMVSCGDVAALEITGIQMVTGTTLELGELDFDATQNKPAFKTKTKSHEILPDPLAIVAFIVALAGFGASFVNLPPIRIFTFLMGSGGTILLLLLKSGLTKQALKDGGGLLILHYQFGFWLALFLFLSSALLSLYLVVFPAPLPQPDTASNIPTPESKPDPLSKGRREINPNDYLPR